MTSAKNESSYFYKDGKKPTCNLDEVFDELHAFDNV
jgi:hypothetical protein